MSTPEQIVAMIANIANRPDIRKAQEEQILLIKAYVRLSIADELEKIGKTLMELSDLKTPDEIAEILFKRAQEVRHAHSPDR